MSTSAPLEPVLATRSGALRAVLLAAGLFALAFAIRLLPLGAAFTEDGVRFPSGNDEVYHVRRVVYDVLRFPEMIDFDPYVSFPYGARPIWPPYFDWLLAAVIRLLAGRAEPGVVERIVFFVPPLLGATTVVVCCEIGRRLVSPLAGFVAGIVLALLPAHFANSRLGQLDNQGVVSLASALLLLAAVELARERPGRAHARVVLTSLVIAAGILIWPAFVLYLLPVQAMAVAWVLGVGERERACERALRCAVPLGVAALLVAPLALRDPIERFDPYSPLVLSRFQPLWLGAGAAAFALGAGMWRLGAFGATRGRRLASALGAGAVGLAAAFVAVPRFAATLRHAGGWFTDAEPALRVVAELQPLLSKAGADPSDPYRSLSLGIFGFPLVWLALSVRGRRGAETRKPLLLVLVWSAVLFAATLAQRRFADPFAIGLALTLGLGAGEIGRWIGARGRAREKLGFALALCAALALALAPGATLYQRVAARSLRGLAGAPAPPGAERKSVVEQAAKFLRGESPRTRGYLDVSLTPEYGVLAPWDDGHLLRQVAQRPTVQDNFLIYGDRRASDRAAAYYQTRDEEQAYRIATGLRARYVVATGVGSGHAMEVPFDSIGKRLWRDLGGAQVLVGGGEPLPALGRHRLIWIGGETGAHLLARPEASRVAVFEIVRGALVLGEAEADAPVGFELALAVAGTRVRYRARVVAGPDGLYRARLPYATDAPASSQVRCIGAYRVAAGASTAELHVTDAGVRAGGEIRGPNLRATSEPID